MLRRNAERHLVIVVVVISLALAGLTVWAIARQGCALRDREMSDLRSSALQAAAERSIQLRGDLGRALDDAAAAWKAGRHDGLDQWVAGQREWMFAAVRNGDGSCAVFPLAPAPPPLPASDSDQLSLARVSELTEAVASAALARLAHSADSQDAMTRARALMAMGAYQRRLTCLRAAAGSYADAAAAFRSSSSAARYAFEAELAQIDCLLALGDQAQAGHALAALLDQTLAAHPAGYGPDQVRGLRRRAAALTGRAQAASLDEQLEQLEERARIRTAVPAVAAALDAGHAEPDSPVPSGIHFQCIDAGADVRLAMATRSVSPSVSLALAARVTDLIHRYWDDAADASWQVVLPGEAPSAEPLCRLGAPFGEAALAPTADTREWLVAHARRRAAFLAVTAAGTAGAWGIVIWMMLRAMARQRELVRLQRRFVADMSHELKTPLAMIRLLAETLQDGRVRDPQRASAYYSTITREAERLSALLDGILDFSRIESGRKQYRFADCDVSEVARQAWSLFEPQFAAEGFEARLEIDDHVPTVQADPAALQQVIVNLLQNAYRYCGEHRYVRLAVRREGYLIVIVVEDHGIGMSRTQLARLGETFFRAEDTRVRQARGSGLGLAIVNHVVQAHGGKLEVQSRPGQGSTFTVWFPYQRRASGAE